jgi:hypothetical protein
MLIVCFATFLDFFCGLPQIKTVSQNATNFSQNATNLESFKIYHKCHNFENIQQSCSFDWVAKIIQRPIFVQFASRFVCNTIVCSNVEIISHLYEVVYVLRSCTYQRRRINVKNIPRFSCAISCIVQKCISSPINSIQKLYPTEG